MLKILLSACAFLLTLAACVWATVAISRGPIERDLTKRSLVVLGEVDGFREDFCEISFVGRDGLVRGEMKSEEQKTAAEQRLQELYGARVIETEFIVRPFDAPRVLVERQGENTIRVEGLLAQASERDAVAAGLAGLDGLDGELDVRIEIRDRVEPAAWVADLVVVAGDLLPQAKSGRVEFRDGKWTLGGELPDAEAEKLFVAGTRERLAATGFDKMEFALTVAPPPEPASFVLHPPEDGVIVVSGRLADLDEAQGLLSLLRSSGNWIIKDQIVVKENTAPAPWVEGLGFLLPSMLSEVVGASVKIEGAQLRLGGQISEDMLLAVSEVAAQNFPASQYEVHNRLRMMSPPREAMVSVLTYPGRVQLKGLLAEAALKERIVQAVEGAIGDGELLSDELQVDANVMEADWVEALVGLVPPYVKQVQRGGLTIYSNILAVEAVIDSDAERDLIWAMTEQFFPDDKYRRLLELRFPEEVEGGIAAEGENPGDEQTPN